MSIKYTKTGCSSHGANRDRRKNSDAVSLKVSSKSCVSVAYVVRDEAEYFGQIPEMKIPGEMLKLAEHIVELKTADPKGYVDRYEEAVVDLLRQKQSGKALGKPTKAAAKPTGNVIEL